MKKCILMLVAMLTISLHVFASDAKTTEIERVERYDLNVDLRRLGTFLNLSENQIDGMRTVETELHNDLMLAAFEDDAEVRKNAAKNAIDKHVKHVHFVLKNKEQYRKYLLVLNATIRNRELLSK